jgi:5-formyltetrahydrofolate cyclo-ligase
VGGSARAGRVGVAEVQLVDPGVCGSGAVNRRGARVGKGGGFPALGFVPPVGGRLISKGAVLASIHPSAASARARRSPRPARLPLHLIAADGEVITCHRARRPCRILWAHLDTAQDRLQPWQRGGDDQL